jgi:D-3-phosphoglycerate dehydrogenase
MYRSVRYLEDEGVEFERMDWHGDLSGTAFRDVTMDMEALGPNEYDATDIVAALDGAEILIVHKAPVSRVIIEAGDDLEIVAAARGGTENVEVRAAEERDVTVLHAPGRNANAVSDYAVSFACAVHRRIPEFVATTGRGEWALEFDPSGLPSDLENLTVGIVGFGNIGRKVADRWAGFEPTLVAFDPYVSDEDIRAYGVEPLALEELLETADVVTLHARLSAESHHLIGEAELELMGAQALLVNTARGGLVDTEALVDALSSGLIGGAALDVFEEEPLPADHPLLDLENVWLSPHTAGSTRDAVLNGARIVARDLERLFDGENPRYRVSR